MKTLAATALVAGLVMSVYGQAQLTDITTYEAAVIDDASGAVLANAGPWLWEDMVAHDLNGPIEGTARSIVVKCRNAAGDTIYGGTIVGVDLLAASGPMGPMGPPIPTAPVALTFVPDNYTVAVYLNGQEYLGEMLMLPAEDDPPAGPVTLTVDVDIKPGSVKNPFNVKSCGKLPVVVYGSAELDVKLIDPASIKLATIAPVCQGRFDVQGDGIADQVMLFQNKDVASLVPDAVDGEVVTMELTGALTDGTLIKGSDSITLVVPKVRGRCGQAKDRDNDRCNGRDNKK
jgi:hypothetical protein